MPSHHVLVVDDDADIRESLGELFEREGYSVRQAENGLVALRMISERRPALIMLDLMMPVMSGWEVLERLLNDSDLRAIPVVVISAAGNPPPNVVFVGKPCVVEVLLEALRSAGVPLASDHAGHSQ